MWDEATALENAGRGTALFAGSMYLLSAIGWFITGQLQGSWGQTGHWAAYTSDVVSLSLGTAGLITYLAEVAIIMMANTLRKEAVQRGINQGREATQSLWEAWNNARIQWETEHPGEHYPEPPPSLNGNQHS